MTTKHKHAHTRQSRHSIATRLASALPTFLNPAKLVFVPGLSAPVLLVMVMLLLGFAGWRVSAQWATASPASSQTHTQQNGLAAALNVDGSLRAGANGSFDASGFRMEYTATGAPRFVPVAAQAECGGWDTQFSLSNGVDNFVRGLAVSGTDIYVGGTFTSAGNIAANHVAKFNTLTNTWSALGTGDGNGVGYPFGATVNALAVSGNDLYVGGDFTTANAGGTIISANNVAKVNMTTGVWSALGTGGGNGVNFTASALVVSGSDLYIGGRFTTANVGGTTIRANNVVKFNTTTGVWSALGTGGGNGVDSAVNALAVTGSHLYVGGRFGRANIDGTTVLANGVAKFNTTNSVWSALGTGGGRGVDSTVIALAVSGSNLYVGGAFQTANVGGQTVHANRIAKFDTTTGVWSALGTDGNGVNSLVQALAVIGSDLYVGGGFTAANPGSVDVPANQVTKFNTTTGVWSALGTGGGNGVSGANSSVQAMAVSGSDLYVGGFFAMANMGGTAIVATNVAKFNTTSGVWSPLDAGNGNGITGGGNGFVPQVRALAVSGTDIYVGGQFTAVGNIAANRVAKFNTLTNTWSALGTGGGNGVSGENIPVRALAVIGSDLYVGGDFTMANVGGTSIGVNRVAKVNTTTGAWSTLGTDNNGVNGPFGSGIVLALAVIGSDLYVGGNFIIAGNVAANGIAKFSTLTGVWSALGTGGGNGVDGVVYALAVSGGDLYVGGNIATANVGGTTISVNNIAKFSALTGVWSALGTGGGNGVSEGDIPVRALAVIGNDLYVGGRFMTANVGGTTVSVSNIAKVNTLTGVWSSLGTGGGNGVGGIHFPSVDALTVIGSDLYVGGTFATANAGGSAVSVNSVAKFNTTTGVWSGLADICGGNGVNGAVLALAVSGGDLYVGGNFTLVGYNKASQRIGRFRNSCNNSAPNITAAAGVTRVEGNLISNSQIATVSDTDQAAGTLAVTVNGGASATVNGVTVSGLRLSAAGQVTADIAAAANATTANFTLRAGDCAGSSSEATLTVTVFKYSGTVSDPLVCTGPGNTVAVTLVLGNPGAAPLSVSDTTTFTNLVGLPGTCMVTPNVGTCAVTNGGLTYTATLAANQTVTLNYLTQVADNVAPGAQVCTNNAASFGGGAPVNLQICGTVNCPVAGPGLPLSAASPISDQKAGSVLVYNVYTSASDPARQNTRIALTNTHTTLSTAVHLFFVDGSSCSVADANVCLTANQTATFLASDLDPGTTGYIVAVAVGADGCPINFNYLVGDEYVKFSSGHAANLGAEAIAALAGGLPSCNTNLVTAQLNFDGISYNRVPRALALDNIPSRADGNDTLLILNRFGGNLGIGAETLINLFGILYNDTENSVSFGFGGASSSPGTCQFRSSLSNNFPRVTPRFEQFLPAGSSGWMRLYSQSDIGLLGAALTFNPDTGATGGAFTGGHNLHKLTLTSAMVLTIPVFPPSC